MDCYVQIIEVGISHNKMNVTTKSEGRLNRLIN